MKTIIVILVLALVAAIATVIFALGNSGIVTVNFLQWSFDSSLTLLMLAPLILGFLLGWLVSVPASIRHMLTVSANSKQANDYESKMERLKAAHKKQLEDTDVPVLSPGTPRVVER